MKFNSQICTTREQSKRLLALGLKKETADMAFEYIPIIEGWIKTEFKWEEQNITEFRIPAWSLHRLWELLPKSIWHDNGFEKKYHPIIEYGFVNYVTYCGMELFDFDCGYEVWRSMIVVIEWLIKDGHFNKEYLD